MNSKTDRSQIPEAVAESVDRYLDSLDGLEILLFLFQQPDRACAAGEVAATLGVPLPRAQRSLQHLARVGLCIAQARSNGAMVYRYAPSGPDELAAAEQIVGSYKTRRVALINYVASEALNRIRSLGEAFRLKKGDTHD